MKKMMFFGTICFLPVALLQAQTVSRYNNLNKSFSEKGINVNLPAPQEYNTANIEFDTSVNKYAITLPSSAKAFANKTKRYLEDSTQNIEELLNNEKSVHDLKLRLSRIEADLKIKHADSLLEAQKVEAEKTINLLEKKIKDLRTSQAELDKKYQNTLNESNALNNKLLNDIVKLEKELLAKVKEIYKNDSTVVEKDYINAKTEVSLILQEIDKQLESLGTAKLIINQNIEDTAVIRKLDSTQMNLIVRATNQRTELTDNLANKLEDLGNAIKTFNRVSVFFDFDIPVIDSIIHANIAASKAKLNSSLKAFKDANDKFKKTYDKYISDYKAGIAFVQSKVKPKAENSSSTDASLLANITKPLNQNAALIPDINIFAAQAVELQDVGMLYQAKLFVAGTGSDTNNLNSASRLFIPEASQLGFMADVTFNFIRATNTASSKDKKMGINFGFYYRSCLNFF